MGGNKCESGQCHENTYDKEFQKLVKQGDVIYFEYRPDSPDEKTNIVKYIIMKPNPVTTNDLLVGDSSIIPMANTVARQADSLDGDLVPYTEQKLYFNRILLNSIKIVDNKTTTSNEATTTNNLENTKSINAYILGSGMTRLQNDLNNEKSVISSMFSTPEISASVISIEEKIQTTWLNALTGAIPNVAFDMNTDLDVNVIKTHFTSSLKQFAPFLRYQDIINKLKLPADVKIPINIVEQLSRILNTPWGKFNEDAILISIKELNTKNKTPFLKSPKEMTEYTKILGNDINQYMMMTIGIPTLDDTIKLLLIGLLKSKDKEAYYPIYLTSDEKKRFVSGKSSAFTYEHCPTSFDRVIIFKESPSSFCMKSDTRLSQGTATSAARGTGSVMSNAASSARGFYNRITARSPPPATPVGGKKRISKKNRKSKK